MKTLSLLILTLAMPILAWSAGKELAKATSDDVKALEKILPYGQYQGTNASGQQCKVTVDVDSDEGTLYGVGIDHFTATGKQQPPFFLVNAGNDFVKLQNGGQVFDLESSSKFTVENSNGSLNVFLDSDYKAGHAQADCKIALAKKI